MRLLCNGICTTICHVLGQSILTYVKGTSDYMFCNGHHFRPSDFIKGGGTSRPRTFFGVAKVFYPPICSATLLTNANYPYSSTLPKKEAARSKLKDSRSYVLYTLDAYLSSSLQPVGKIESQQCAAAFSS